MKSRANTITRMAIVVSAMMGPSSAARAQTPCAGDPKPIAIAVKIYSGPPTFSTAQGWVLARPIGNLPKGAVDPPLRGGKRWRARVDLDGDGNRLGVSGAGRLRPRG